MGACANFLKGSPVKSSLKKGISLAELLGIFAMLGVLCGAITPHLLHVREASRLTKLRFNLEKLRQRIEDYRSRHGRPPDHPIDAFQDVGELAIPENPISNGADGYRYQVKKIDSDPPAIHQVTASGMGGWLYNPETGGIWPDHERFLEE